MRTCAGSSPRMRGTLGALARPKQYGGIIPAYAGNTRRPDPTVRHARDHPRVCGEHTLMGVLAAWWLGSSPRMRGTRIPIASATSRWGSSPRMRGTPPCANAYENLCGIIPAYAGNTSYRTCRCKSRMDHPRVCGEHTLPERYRYLKKGSSPRMRGTP